MASFGQAGLLAAASIVAVTGVWLTVSGRPFGTLLQTLHKLAALVGFVYLGVLVWQTARGALSGNMLLATLATAVLAVASFASGGIVSAAGSASVAVVWLHRVASWLSLGFAAWLAWLLSSIA